MTARERASYAVRLLVSHALFYAGILHLIRRIRLKDKAVVLMYHRVLTPEQCRATASQPGLIVQDATFARHMAVLKRYFTVLTLSEFADRLERRVPFDGPCCLITFDDGWIDNLRNALPVLRHHGLPAVVFLPVNLVGSERLFPREALTHLLVRAIGAVRSDPRRRDALRGHLAPFGLDAVLDCADDDPLAAAVDALRVHRYASGPEFESLAEALSRELGVGAAELSRLDTFIDWAQVDEMRRQGIAFGGHGAEHRVLTQVPPDLADFEIATSMRVLEERLGATPVAFAYPNGGWNLAVAATVRATGYRLGFTIENGPVSCGDDLLALKRVNMHEGMTRSTPMFLARLAGLF